MSVRLKIVQIGNSQGIRLPKPLLEQCQISKEVEAEVRDGVIILRSVKKKHRQGWAVAFKEMTSHSDDKLLLGDLQNEFDESDWQWK